MPIVPLAEGFPLAFTKLAHPIPTFNRGHCLEVSPAQDPAITGQTGVLQNLLRKELQALAKPDCFATVQTEIREHMRTTVVGWMAEVCEEDGCRAEVLALAVNLLDRFLSVEAIHAKHLQLLATACLFVASKYRQVHPMAPSRLIEYTDHSITKSELVSWELLLLGRLRWNVSTVVPQDFVEHFVQLLRLPAPLCSRVRELANKYVTLVLSDFSLATLLTSSIAAVCVSTAVYHLLGSRDVFLGIYSILQGVVKLDFNLFVSQVTPIERFLEEHLTKQHKQDTLSGCPGLTSTPGYSTPTPEMDQSAESKSSTSYLASTPTDIADVVF